MKRRQTFIHKYFESYDLLLSFMASQEFKTILQDYKETYFEITELCFEGSYILSVMGIRK